MKNPKKQDARPTGKLTNGVLARTTIEDATAARATNIGEFAHDCLAKFKPPSFGLPSLDLYLYGWKRGANIVIAGRSGIDGADLALTLAEHFATTTGPVIWLGIDGDLEILTQRLLLREAGIRIPEHECTITLDKRTHQSLLSASDRIGSLPIEFCDIDQCSEDGAAQDFLVRATSDYPTLIVVESSVFNEVGLDPFEVLVRRCNLFGMVEELKKSNLDYRVLWQVAASPGNADVTPTTADIEEPSVTASADIVLFARRHVESRPSAAELVIVRNRFGSLDTIAMEHDQALSSWSEPSTFTRAGLTLPSTGILSTRLGVRADGSGR